MTSHIAPAPSANGQRQRPSMMTNLGDAQRRMSGALSEFLAGLRGIGQSIADAVGEAQRIAIDIENQAMDAQVTLAACALAAECQMIRLSESLGGAEQGTERGIFAPGSDRFGNDLLGAAAINEDVTPAPAPPPIEPAPTPREVPPGQMPDEPPADPGEPNTPPPQERSDDALDQMTAEEEWRAGHADQVDPTDEEEDDEEEEVPPADPGSVFIRKGDHVLVRLPKGHPWYGTYHWSGTAATAKVTKVCKNGMVRLAHDGVRHPGLFLAPECLTRID